MEQNKNRRAAGCITAALFLLMLFGAAAAKLLLPDRAVSRAERRKLAQKPALSVSALQSGKFSDELEQYLLDQFPLREELRTAKAALRLFVFRQLDNDGIFLSDGAAYRMDDQLDEKQIAMTARKLTEIYETYLQDSRVYYAAVPGKNNYLTDGRPKLDGERLRTLLREQLPGLQEIELRDCLSAQDYYRTDLHWKQERIYPVAQRLAEAMGASLTPFSDYTERSLAPFYGAYYGQAALPLAPDTLRYLCSAQTDAAVVEGLEFSGTRPVYDPARFSGLDGYDVYLSGAQALLTVTLPDAQTDRELILFRDSFGSSIAPYFLGAYRKITLIDLRYISASLLGEYVDFAGKDVLFLLSDGVINRGSLLK